ncbi:MAG: hypothetical protein FGM62_01600 [Methylobacterium sp.]|nr:hypothetical protein [Methylobacterium sp.]
MKTSSGRKSRPAPSSCTTPTPNTSASERTGEKMKKFLAIPVLAGLFLSAAACADDAAQSDEQEKLHGIVRRMIDDNASFTRSHNSRYFKPFVQGQHPRATVVTCADSRVHTHAFDNKPDDDLFMVRNIGNQISTAEGSVDYGVHHLHTPLLIIIGHVACGAIKAARSDYSRESASIRRELDTIKLPVRNPANDDDEEVLRGIDANVNNQVAFALKKFTDEIKEGKLTVIGAIYDFRNDLHQGQGRLVVTNINGNTDSANIMSGLMKLTASVNAPEKKAAAQKGVDKKPAPEKPPVAH